LTEDDLGFPKVQKIEAHRIGDRSGHDFVENGPFEGLKIVNGVVKNIFGRVLAYQILGDKKEDDRIIEANAIIKTFDPEWHSQGRGIPAFSAVIPELRKAKTSEEWELMAQLVHSAHSIIEYNDSGAADFTGGEHDLYDDGLNVQTFSGGLVRYMKANSGNKIESVTSSRPSDMWDNFQDRVQRMACTAVKWAYELTWKPEGLNGVSVRSVQDKARHAVAQRQDVLLKSTIRQARWAVSVAMKNGYLSEPENATDWDKFTYSMPPQMTIDPRHDAKTDMEDYKLGRKNMTQLLKRDGKSLIPHLKERLYEIVQRKLLKEQYEQEYGVQIDDREMFMLTPNEMAENNSNNQENDSEEE
jgi:capsid protein